MSGVPFGAGDPGNRSGMGMVMFNERREFSRKEYRVRFPTHPREVVVGSWRELKRHIHAEVAVAITRDRVARGTWVRKFLETHLALTMRADPGKVGARVEMATRVAVAAAAMATELAAGVRLRHVIDSVTITTHVTPERACVFCGVREPVWEFDGEVEYTRGACQTPQCGGESAAWAAWAHHNQTPQCGGESAAWAAWAHHKASVIVTG